jgi:hypothetical protein
MDLPGLYYDQTHVRDRGGQDREGGEKLFAEMLRQRRGGLFAGRHPTLGGMGGHPSPFAGAYSMGPMLGGNTRHGFPPPMGMGMGIGTGMGTGMGDKSMGMGMGMRMSGMPGMGFAMGMDPYVGMGGIGAGPGRPPLGHSPFGHHRRSPFSHASPGPPRAHSFLPQPRHSHLPFSRPRQNPFSSPKVIFDEDDFDDDYRMPPRRSFGRQRRDGFRFAPRYSSRRGAYQPTLFEDSEDEYDDYDGYDDDYEDEDEFEEYIPRRSPYMRLPRGY